MLRFSLNPTRDMNLSDLRIALFNYILSKQKNEDFIVMVQDLDKDKIIDAQDQENLDILALFGIHYSQVIYHSKNFRFHSAMALQLLHEKKAFSCFCSDEWLNKKKEEAKQANIEYKYDDACRNLPAELVIDNTAPFSVRIVSPDKDIGIKSHSFIILNRDKTPAPVFAYAVDDMINDISTVVCSNNEIKNNIEQEYIRDTLGYKKKITYINLPTLLNDNIKIKDLLKDGYLPEAILNYLISIGNNTPKEIFTLSEAIEWFDFDKIPEVSTDTININLEDLKHINKKHLKNLDAKELSRYVGFADEEIGKLAHIYLNEINTTKELKSKIDKIFESRKIANELKDSMSLLKNTIKKAPFFEEYDDFKNYLLKNLKIEEKYLTKLLYILLVNDEKNTLDISKIYKYLKNYLGEIIK